MRLAEWEEKVRPHLNYIIAGSEMAARHARALPFKPGFYTKAEADLEDTRKVLEAALAEVVLAQATINAKPEESRAA